MVNGLRFNAVPRTFYKTSLAVGYYGQTDNILLTQRQIITDLFFVCTYVLNINSMLNQYIIIHKNTISVNDIIIPSSCITFFFYYYWFFITSCNYRYILKIFVFEYIWKVCFSYSNTFFKVSIRIHNFYNNSIYKHMASCRAICAIIR